MPTIWTYFARRRKKILPLLGHAPVQTTERYLGKND
jgi:hypothetical protein